MTVTGLRDSNLFELNARARTFIVACGYESRSAALVRKLAPSVGRRIALGFAEWDAQLSRPKNEEIFKEAGFSVESVRGSDSRQVAKIVSDSLSVSDGALAFDISSMTRTWHAGIVRALRSATLTRTVETFFAYVPAQYTKPPTQSSVNETVAPLEGFASLSQPDLPVAALIGLGYEKERALGLQQLLDPQRTILLIPRFHSREDRFHSEVLKSNRDILSRTQSAWQFEYPLDEPTATFGLLASIVSGLLPSYRVVLASLGPKMLGLLCFLLAVKFPQVSVWRVSSGAHANPRESYGDIGHTVVLSATWA